MTAQGKPDRCPRCGSDGKNVVCGLCDVDYATPDVWHSSPVPAAAPQPTNRHGERVSRECGAGHHAECKETLETCHCTYRGLHKTMHAYATFPTPWEPADYKGYETRLSEEGYREVRKVGPPQAESVPSGKWKAEKITPERLQAYTERLADEGKNILGMYVKHEGGVVCALCEVTTHEGYYYEGIGECCFVCGVRLTMRGLIDAASQTAALAVERDQADRHFVEIAEDNAKLRRRAEAAERSNSLLRERITAAVVITNWGEHNAMKCLVCGDESYDHWAFQHRSNCKFEAALKENQ